MEKQPNTKNAEASSATGLPTPSPSPSLSKKEAASSKPPQPVEAPTDPFKRISRIPRSPPKASPPRARSSSAPFIQELADTSDHAVDTHPDPSSRKRKEKPSPSTPEREEPPRTQRARTLRQPAEPAPPDSNDPLSPDDFNGLLKAAEAVEFHVSRH
ncbi:PREDICTED: extensin-like, partial [Rhagoletis zephyria]|uniref:extensin-like n=1 Tax=Rhagoletis zephyria TaxID=28612 RepID=UPI000811587D